MGTAPSLPEPSSPSNTLKRRFSSVGSFLGVNKIIENKNEILGSLEPVAKLYPSTSSIQQQPLDDPMPIDWKRVRELIQEQKLMPFFAGDAVKDAVECPICFLSYPSPMNHTSCCDKPMCTECFLQIRPVQNVPGTTVCPFCVASNFGVVFRAVSDVATSLSVAERVASDTSLVVRSDQVRPWLRPRTRSQSILHASTDQPRIPRRQTIASERALVQLAALEDLMLMEAIRRSLHNTVENVDNE